MKLDGSYVSFSTAPGADVQEFDEDGEAHREVDVALGDVLVEALQEQSQADKDQEAQGEHLQGGVAVDYTGYGLGGDQHDQYGHRDGGDHHRDLIDHADSGDHRVQRENDVEDDDLDQDASECRLHPGAGVPLLGLKILVDLVGALAQQEEPADDQDHVAPRDLMPSDRKQWCCETYDPAQRKEQEDSHDQCHAEPQPAGERLPLFGQLVHEDGDEHDVVYAKNDLQGKQRQ